MWALGEKTSHGAVETPHVTLLAKGVEFKGFINFDGTIRIDGRVEGEIHTTGQLIVGENAVIKGIVSAGSVVNSGKVNATVTAREKIQLSRTGILIGDIRTPSIAIEDGAHFHGMCDMGAHKWVEEPNSPPKHSHDSALYRGKTRAVGH